MSSNDSSATSGEEKIRKFGNSVLLKLPKFSKDYCPVDFINALEGLVEKSEIRVLGRLKYPNEWTMTLSSSEARERLLQVSHFTVKGKKCVVHPQANDELRGKIHWLPGEIDDDKVLEMLRRFGEVVSFKKDMIFRSPSELRSSVRSFSLVIKQDTNLDDIPHFISVDGFEGLVTVKGRDSICLGCKQHGHRKANCPNSVGHPFKSKKKPVSKPPLAADPDAPKKKKKKPKKKVETAEETASATATASAIATEKINIEESINSFIARMTETLDRLKTDVANHLPPPPVPARAKSLSNAGASGNIANQPGCSNQLKNQINKSKKPASASNVVGATGGTDNAITGANKKQGNQQAECNCKIVEFPRQLILQELALVQRKEADAQRKEAEAQRKEAEAERKEIEAQKKEAEAQRKEAEAHRSITNGPAHVQVTTDISNNINNNKVGKKKNKRKKKSSLAPQV